MIVYKATNKLNGMIYVGQTIHTLDKRMYNHKADVTRKRNLPFINALGKYGFDNFSFEVIDKAENIDTLNDLEEYYITYFNTVVPNGYNLETGGGNKRLHQDTKDKISKANKGKKRKPFTEEHKTKIAKALMGVKHITPRLTEEGRKKISIASSSRTGTVFSPEHREKISRANKGKQARLGKYHTEESKSKISATKIANNKAILCTTNGITYDSVTSAAKSLCISISGVSAASKGVYPSIKGYTFKKVEKK